MTDKSVLEEYYRLYHIYISAKKSACPYCYECQKYVSDCRTDLRIHYLRNKEFFDRYRQNMAKEQTTNKDYSTAVELIVNILSF